LVSAPEKIYACPQVPPAGYPSMFTLSTMLICPSLRSAMTERAPAHTGHTSSAGGGYGRQAG
jgi:hypothetical protein